MQRLLQLDEGLPRRLAEQLRARGHAAQALLEVPGAPTTDTGVIGWLAAGAVLVTTDAGLPREHRRLLREAHATVAIVHAEGEAAKRETVHRWAHVMAAQAPGSVRRYAPRRAG